MKRRVRIYKAQMGGVAAMQNAQEQQAQISDEAIVNAAIEMMQSGNDSDEILQALVSKGVEQEKAVQILSAIVNKISEEKELQLAEDTQDQDTIDDLEAQQMADEQAAQEELAQRQRLQELYGYNTADYEDDTAEEDYNFVNDNIMSTGGSYSKKKFMRNAMKTLRAQEGTEMQQSTADSTDTGERAKQLNNFLGSVKSSGDDALMKKDAEAMYNTVSQYPNSDPNTPTAQFGANMSPRQQRRFNRRLNRFVGSVPIPMNGLMPSGLITHPMLNTLQNYIPSTGSYEGGPRLANIDVRRTGLFGKPKEYTITFAQEALQNPQLKRDVYRLEEYNEEQKIKDTQEEKKDVEEKVTKQAETTSSNRTSNNSSGNSNASGTQSNPYAERPPIVLPPIEQPVVIPPATSGARSIYSNANTPTDMYYYNPDKPGFTYAYDKGKLYYDENPNDALNFIEVTDPTRVKQLNEKLRSGDLYTLPSKSGYYYRMRPDGAYAKFKGDPKKHTSSVQQISVIKPGDTNYDYLKKNAKFFGAYSGQKQTGGFVDPNSDLTKFIYGGNDNIALPEIKGKLTDSPYFEEGGDIDYAQGGKSVRSTRPAPGYTWEEWDKLSSAEKDAINKSVDAYYTESDTDDDTGYNSYSPDVYPGGYVKQKGLPYDPTTGETYYGGFSPYGQIDKIDVTKTRLSGAPKRFTMYYTDYFPTDETVNKTGIDNIVQKNKTEPQEKQKSDLYYKTRQLFQNVTSSKEGDQSPRLRNWFDQKRSERLGVGFPEMAYGGGMGYAQTGQNYPYANDPRFYPELPSEEQQQAFIDAAGRLDTPVADNTPIDFKDVLGMKNYVRGQVNKEGIDPTAFGTEEELKPILADPKQKAINFKTTKSNDEYLRELAAFNVAVNTGLDFLGERGNSEREAQLRNRYLADNLYGSTGQYDRGTYAVDSGLFRPDQMGFKGVIRDGGSIYEEGGETWMSEDDIKKFLEEGGELEFV